MSDEKYSQRESLTFPPKKNRAERVARRATSASRVVVEDPPARKRHLATGGARPLQAHRRSHEAGPLDAVGDLVAT